MAANISRISGQEVLQALDAPAKMDLAKRLSWPYNGMVADITSAIETGCNYLVALGLCCYTEACGREILFRGDLSKKDWECFNEFVRYTGAGELLEKEITFEEKTIKFKDAVRNGLAPLFYVSRARDGCYDLTRPRSATARLPNPRTKYGCLGCRAFFSFILPRP
jgi:hypothetical protein